MTGNKNQAYIWFFAKKKKKKKRQSIYRWSQKFTYTFQNLQNVDYFTK